MTAQNQRDWSGYWIGVPLIGLVHFFIAQAIVWDALSHIDEAPPPSPPGILVDILSAPFIYPFLPLGGLMQRIFGFASNSAFGWLYLPMFLNAVLWGFILTAMFRWAPRAIKWVKRQRATGHSVSS